MGQYDIDLMFEADEARKEAEREAKKAQRVTIHRIEVRDPDPDKWVAQLAEKVRKEDFQDPYQRPRFSAFEILLLIYVYGFGLVILSASC